MKISAQLTACCAVLIILFAFFNSPAMADQSALQGQWILQQKSKNGLAVADATGALIITGAAFNLIDYTPAEDACAFSGELALAPATMRVTVGISSCSTGFPVGDTAEFQYALAPDGSTLTMTRTTVSGQTGRTYKRPEPGGGGPTPTQPCTHPFCGTWNRTATYVNGELANNSPAYTVITDNEFFSITNVCFNRLTITQVDGANVTLSMIGHNCPTPAGYMPPGTIIVQTFQLSENAQKLTVVNTQYGATVTTIFARLP